MTLRVSGKNMDLGEALRAKAEGYFDAVVKKYFDGNYTGHMTLEPEGSGFCAECMMHLDSGAVLMASAYGGDPISAYQLMTETIEKRLRRYNRKLKQHRRHGNGSEAEQAPAYVLAAPEDSEEVEEDYSPPVIAETTASLRQMSVGEAVMELDLRQSEVVVFRHAGHGGVSVVYRRTDGNIGWIDPALRAG